MHNYCSHDKCKDVYIHVWLAVQHKQTVYTHFAFGQMLSASVSPKQLTLFQRILGRLKLWLRLIRTSLSRFKLKSAYLQTQLSVSISLANVTFDIG